MAEDKVAKGKQDNPNLARFAVNGSELAVHGPDKDGHFYLIPYDQWGDSEPNCLTVRITEVPEADAKKA